MSKNNPKTPETTVPKGYPPPPNGLPLAQVALWRDTVTSFPADFFRTSDFPLLIELVRAITTANMLSSRIEEARGDAAELKALLSLRDTESRRAASLSKALRACPSARYDRQQVGTSCRKSKTPWRSNPFDEFLRTDADTESGDD